MDSPNRKQHKACHSRAFVKTVLAALLKIGIKLTSRLLRSRECADCNLLDLITVAVPCKI